MSRIVVYPYKMGSRSARELARDLGALRVYPDRAYRPRSGDFIINWGSSTIPIWYGRSQAVSRAFLNKPESVAVASNKLRTFNQLQDRGVSIPDFTTDSLVADQWLEDGYTVYARTVLTGHSGNGVVVMRGDDEEPMVSAPLYVKGIENHGEYRVHVFRDEVISYQKKRRRVDDLPSQEDLDIRNLASNWVYTRDNLRRLERIETLARQAISALDLDFGAVDIIKDQDGNVFVLEVNTACGMDNRTKEAYLSTLRLHIG